jgi:3-hydroxyisobutyrate dehydrogenase-like beta-hydroxyacid dehydrogenase
MKVGFIGLGRMGGALARRLLDAGHDLALYNRTPGKVADLVAAGAAQASSIGEAARHGGVAVTMLANDVALDAVARDPGGLIESLPAGGVHVAMGTHGLATLRALAKAHAGAGQVLVSAPVLGRPEAVTAGKLVIITGGPPDAVARCQPLFEAMGRRTFAAGGQPEAAAAIKLANNFMLASAIEAIGEAFALIEKTGAERGVFQEIIADGPLGSPAYAGYAKIIADKAYDNVGFTATLALKDVNLVLAAAETVAAPMPSASLVRDRLLGAIAHGDAERDWAVLALEQARASGLA